MSSLYGKFIAANEALFKCMESVPVAQYEAMSADAQVNVCKAESDNVAEFLKNDSVGFRGLIHEKLASLNKQWENQPKCEEHTIVTVWYRLV